MFSTSHNMRPPSWA